METLKCPTIKHFDSSREQQLDLYKLIALRFNSALMMLGILVHVLPSTKTDPIRNVIQILT